MGHLYFKADSAEGFLDSVRSCSVFTLQCATTEEVAREQAVRNMECESVGLKLELWEEETTMGDGTPVGVLWQVFAIKAVDTEATPVVSTTRGRWKRRKLTSGRVEKRQYACQRTQVRLEQRSWWVRRSGTVLGKKHLMFLGNANKL